MRIYCPKLKCGGSKEIEVCLYSCPRATILRCPEYAKVYPQLVNFEINPKYIERYGEAKIVIPPRYLKKKRRHPCLVKKSTAV